MPGCARTLVLAALALLLDGCGTPPPLTPPGAREVMFQLWGQPGEPPTIIQAHQLIQVQAGSFDHLRFSTVSVRRSFVGGVVVLVAPTGSYERDTGTLELDGPVLISGTMDGEPVLGVAEHAVVHQHSHLTEMIGGSAPGAQTDPRQQVVILYEGSVIRSWRFTCTTPVDAPGHPHAHELGIASDPYPTTCNQEMPELATILAALPRPLVLPTVLPSLAP